MHHCRRFEQTVNWTFDDCNTCLEHVTDKIRFEHCLDRIRWIQNLDPGENLLKEFVVLGPQHVVEQLGLRDVAFGFPLEEHPVTLKALGHWRQARQEAEWCIRVLCHGVDHQSDLVGRQNLGRKKHCRAIVQFPFLVTIQHGLLVGRDILVDVENASLQQLQRVFHTLAPLLTFLCFEKKWVVAILESDLNFHRQRRAVGSLQLQFLRELPTIRATPSHIHGGLQNGFVGTEMRLANPNDHLGVRLVGVDLNRVCVGSEVKYFTLTSQ